MPIQVPAQLYAYVSREIHPATGYLIGWSMMFDYVMTRSFASYGAASNRGPSLPSFCSSLVMVYHICRAFTGLNLRGIEELVSRT